MFFRPVFPSSFSSFFHHVFLLFFHPAEIHVLGACNCAAMTGDVLSFALVTPDSLPAACCFLSTQCELRKFCLTQCGVVAQHGVFGARVARHFRCLLFLPSLSVHPGDETVSS